MPYKNPEDKRAYQRVYQRRWHAERKRAFFAERSCEACGTERGLVLARAGCHGSLRELTGGVNPWSLPPEGLVRLMDEHGWVLCWSCRNLGVWAIQAGVELIRPQDIHGPVAVRERGLRSWLWTGKGE